MKADSSRGRESPVFAGPIPRGRIALRVAAVIAAPLIVYRVTGPHAPPGTVLLASAWAEWRNAPAIAVSETAVNVGGIVIDFQPYWLASAATLVAIGLLIFRDRSWYRILLGTVSGIVIATGMYATSILLSVELANRHVSWAANVSSGTFAFLLSIAIFMTAFATQVSLSLTGRGREKASGVEAGSG